MLSIWFCAVLASTPVSPTLTHSNFQETLPEDLVALVENQAISEAEFHRYLSEELFGESIGNETMEYLIDEAVVLREARKRSLGASAGDVRERIRDFDERMRQEGASLSAYLRKAGLSSEEFEASVRQHLLHEQMAREDFGIDEDEEVPPVKLRMWLKDRRERSSIRREGLPAGVVLNVEGREIQSTTLGSVIEKKMTATTRREHLSELIGIILIERFLKDRGIPLSEEDFQKEIANREDLLRRRHDIESVTLKDMIGVKGQTIEGLVKTRRFQAETGLGRIVDLEYGRDGLRKFYEDRKQEFDTQFGRRLDVSTIFLKAVQRPNQFADRTFEIAEKIIENKVKKGIDEGSSFEDLVYFYSEHPSSRNKGRLGLLNETNPEHKPIIDALRDAMPGDTAGPIRALTGVHFVRLDSISKAPPFEELVLEIRQAVRQHKYREILDSISSDQVKRRY